MDFGNILNWYDKNPNPHHRNHRNPDPKISLSSLVIEGILHTEPYTIHSSDQCEYPESSLRYPPPFIDRLHFIHPHDTIGEEIDDEEIVEHSLSLRYKSNNGIYIFVSEFIKSWPLLDLASFRLFLLARASSSTSQSHIHRFSWAR